MPSFQQEGPPEQQQDWQHDSQDSCQASEAFCVADKANDFNADALPDELNENLWLCRRKEGETRLFPLL
jgi:hypothetical protein